MLERWSVEDTDGGPKFYVRDDSGGLAVLTEEEAESLMRWLSGFFGPGLVEP